jgi:hypothetical protein
MKRRDAVAPVAPAMKRPTSPSVRPRKATRSVTGSLASRASVSVSA